MYYLVWSIENDAEELVCGWYFSSVIGAMSFGMMNSLNVLDITWMICFARGSGMRGWWMSIISVLWGMQGCMVINIRIEGKGTDWCFQAWTRSRRALYTSAMMWRTGMGGVFKFGLVPCRSDNCMFLVIPHVWTLIGLCIFVGLKQERSICPISTEAVFRRAFWTWNDGI